MKAHPTKQESRNKKRINPLKPKILAFLVKSVTLKFYLSKLLPLPNNLQFLQVKWSLWVSYSTSVCFDRKKRPFASSTISSRWSIAMAWGGISMKKARGWHKCKEKLRSIVPKSKYWWLRIKNWSASLKTTTSISQATNRKFYRDKSENSGKVSMKRKGNYNNKTQA